MPSLNDVLAPLISSDPMPTLAAAKTSLETYLLPEPVAPGDPVPSDAANGSALWESKAAVAGTAEAATVAQAAAALDTLVKDAARQITAAASLSSSVSVAIGTYLTDVSAAAASLTEDEGGLGPNRLQALKVGIAELVGQGDVSVVDTELLSLVEAEAASSQTALSTAESGLQSAEGRLGVARLALQVASAYRDRVQAAITARARAALVVATSTQAAFAASEAAIAEAEGLQDEIDAYLGQIAALEAEITDLQAQLTAEPDPGTPTAVLLAGWIAERGTEKSTIEAAVEATELQRLHALRAAVIAYHGATDGRARLVDAVNLSTWDPQFDIDADGDPTAALTALWSAASTGADLAHGAYVAAQLAHRQAVIALAEAKARHQAWVAARGEAGSDLSDALDAAIEGFEPEPPPGP